MKYIILILLFLFCCSKEQVVCTSKGYKKIPYKKYYKKNKNIIKKEYTNQKIFNDTININPKFK